MKKCVAALCLSAVSLSAYPAIALDLYTFSQGGWSNNGVLEGRFAAEDINQDGQITSFTGEVLGFSATYRSDTINQTNFSSLGPVVPLEFLESEVIIPPFFGFGDLVFSLNEGNFLGDATERNFAEGIFSLNEQFILDIGGGFFGPCDGVSVCGGLFDDRGPIIPVALASSEIQPEVTLLSINEAPPIAEGAAAVTNEAVAITSIEDIDSVVGLFESSPVLPRVVNDDGGFVFDLDNIRTLPGEIFFIDPEIAVGYTYEITGDTFAAVQAPSFLAVPDAEYTLSFNNSEVTLMSGEIFTFNETVTKFEITGINPGLGLQPTDTNAFVTGVAVTTGTSGATITQTPITVNAVPLPASGVLLLSGLAGIAFLRRRRKALHA